MTIPPGFLDELRARTGLPERIGRRTRLVRHGRQWKGCCPFHQEKTPSFYVYDDHYHCFGCGAHGDAIGFVMQAEGLAFPEAVERLAGEAGLEVPKPTPEAAARARAARDLHGVLALAGGVYRRLLAGPEGAAARAYLDRRGIDTASIERFGLGWSGPGRGSLAAALEPEGVTRAQLVAAGLMQWRNPDDPGAGATDLFFDRVMFPIRDRAGRVIAQGGRTLGDGQPKYLNGPETELFRKRETLYGIDLAREAAYGGAPVLVVEGYLDVIALHQAGFAGAVAPLGTALTEAQLALLWRLTPEPVLCFDGDAAGAKAAARTVDLALPELAPERRLRLAALPAGEDPDSLLARGGPPAFAAVLAAASPPETFLLPLLRSQTGAATPAARAALLDAIEAACRRITHRAYGAELRAALRGAFYASTRKRGPAAAAAVARGVPCADQVRTERARRLLAISLRHPEMLTEIEEPLAMLDLPPGSATRLRDGLLRCLAAADRLDTAIAVDHLARAGLQDEVAWALSVPGLVPEAGAATLPQEALWGWWHFFGLLRGTAALEADRDAARADWLASNAQPAADRFRHLADAVERLRRYEQELG